MDSESDLGPKKSFLVEKKFFFVFSSVLGRVFCISPENSSSSLFTFEKIPVRLVFFRVFLLSLIRNIMFYTGVRSRIWAGFGSEKKIFFARKNFFFVFPDVLGSFFWVF